MNALIDMIRSYGFTEVHPHNCIDTSRPMRAFFFPNDPYKDTGCYVDTVSGELEIDIDTSVAFVGDPNKSEMDIIKLVLEQATASVNSYLSE